MPSLPAGAKCETHPYVAAAYLCARCGSFLCTECTVIAEDAESYCLACERQLPGANPWEQRRRIGLWRALGRTFAAVVLSPGTFFRHPPRERSVWPAMLFGFLWTALVDVVDLARAIVVWRTDPGHREAFVEGFRQGARSLPGLAEHAELAWALTELGRPLLSPLWFGLWLGVAAGGWWLALRVVGARGIPFGEVVRGLSYTNVVAIAGLATMWMLGPLLIFFTVIVGLWAAVLQILAMSRLVGDMGRAVGAFFVMAVTLFGLACLLCLLPVFLVALAGAL